jgi:hypothetical protein
MRNSLFLLAMLCAAPAYAQVYRCVGGDGKTVYQGEPCQLGSRQSAVQMQDSKGVSTTSRSLAGPEVEKVVVRYRACAAHSQDLADLHGASFEQWRARHAAAYAAFEADPAAVQRVKEAFESEKARQRTLTKAEHTTYFHRCYSELGDLLAVAPRAGPEPDYMSVVVTYMVCRRVAVQDGLDGKFAAWSRRHQEGAERFRRENEPAISRSVSEGIKEFEMGGASDKARTRALCRGDLNRWLEEGA